jgi:hypothetical protein
MSITYSYIRLILASWLLLGGVSLQFVPSAAAVDRDGRWRERRIQSVPTDQRPQWVQEQDSQDARAEANVRLFGVLMGGIGLGMLIHEATYLSAVYRLKYSRPAVPPVNEERRPEKFGGWNVPHS